MIPIYVISLSSASERRKHINQHMKATGLQYSIEDAVNGNALSAKEIEELCSAEALKKHPKWLSRGAIGCALSHLNVYRKIILQQEEWALILEDDVVLPKDLGVHLEKITQVADSDDVIMLYYQSWKPLALSQSNLVQYHNEYGLFYPVDIAQPITTGAYLISRKGAERLAEGILPIRVCADSWGYFFKSDLIKSMRCVYPRPVNVAPFKSSIDYIQSPVFSKISKFVNRVRLPGIYQLLKNRRIKGFQERQLVEVSNEFPQWQKNSIPARRGFAQHAIAFGVRSRPYRSL